MASCRSRWITAGTFRRIDGKPSVVQASGSDGRPRTREHEGGNVSQVIRFVVVVLVVLGGSIAARAEEADGWKGLAEPGTHILMRHAEAPGTGDPTGFELGNCATQRNLSEAGRDQARRVGAAIMERGIEVDRILASQWCRASETARLLGLGAVEEDGALNSFFGNRETSRRQSDAFVRMLSDLDRNGERAILVTHQVNITALTDVFPASGELILVRVSDGDLEVLGRWIPARAAGSGTEEP